MGRRSKRTYRLTPITGGINSVAESGTLRSVFDNRNGIGTELRDMENVSPLRRGGITSISGFTAIHQEVTAEPINGLYEYRRSNGTTQFLMASGTNLYTWTDSVLSSAIHTTLANDRIHFETADDLCIICDGTNAVQKYDGSTVSALVGSPPTGMKQSLFYKNRLWLFGNSSNKSLLYYSDPVGTSSGIESGYGTNFVDCDVDDGQAITGIASFFVAGQLEPVIVVAKERSVGIVTGDGTTSNPFVFNKVNKELGVPSIEQMVQFGSTLAYFTRDGVASYTIGQDSGDLTYAYLSAKVRDRFSALSSTARDKALMWIDPTKSRFSIAVAEATNDTANVIWHYDIELGAWYKERWAQGQDITASLLTSDGVWYHGDSNSNLYKHNDNDGSFAGEPISSYIQTDFIDFGSQFAYGMIDALHVEARSAKKQSISLKITFDSGAYQANSLSFVVGQNAYTWGGGNWTTDPGVYQWASPVVELSRLYPGGNFRNVAFEFSHSGLNEPYDIFNIELRASKGSEIP